MIYRSKTTEAQPPDEEILAALTEGLLIAGRVDGQVALYRKAPADVWSANPTELGLVEIEALSPVPDGYKLRTIGFTKTLSSPLYRHLRVLVEA